MKKIFFATAILCGTVSAFAQPKLVETVGRKGSALVIPYSKYMLPNGLTVILHEDHSDPLVHVDVTYHVGSAREEIGKSGFAHFFEHMMFQGSDNVGDEQHFKIIGGAGGTLNGSTNLDRTNYYETVPANQLEKMIWLEADRMGFLLDAVTQKKFEIQRSTVKNERGQNYDNRPYGLVGEFTSKNLYPYGHPYSWLTIGYVEDLNRVDVNDLKNFFLRWYGPNNATITIGGDFKPADALKMVDKYFGSIPRGPEVTKTILPAVVLEKDRYVSYTDNYARLPQLSKTFPTVPAYSKETPALDCLAEVLGQGKNSILYQQLVKPQKALNASAGARFSELSGEFTFRLTPYGGQSLAEMDALLKQALTAFEQRGVTDEDIAKFKGNKESDYVARLQSVSGKVSQLAAYQTFTGNPDQTGIQLDMIRKLTKQDVMDAYNRFIKGKYSVTVSVLTKESAADAYAQADNYSIDRSNYKKPDYGYEGLKYVKAKDNFNRTMMPGNGANPVVKVPAFKTTTKANGVRIITSENTEVPLVTVSVRLPGGRLLEPGADKAGVAGITALMLNEDTKNYSAEQMAVELQKLGSSIGVSSSIDGTTYTLLGLKQNLAPGLALLEERMFRPAFNEETFKRIQKQALEGFKQAKSQPATIADRVYEKISYPNSPLGVSSSGTEASIKALTLADVKNFYESTFSSQTARAVVVGDVTNAEAVSGLAFLDKLPNKAISVPRPARTEAIAKPVLYVVDVPKAAQTEFRVGMPTNLMYDATGEFYRAGLLNYTIGGDFNSRLNINLREAKGWTYGARSSFSGNEYTGMYTFSSGIRADATDSALAEVIRELKLYSEKGISPEELTFLKGAIGQRDALTYETGAQKAAFVGRILQYNLPATYADTQNGILKNFTKTEMDALAKKWLNPEHMNILLVGDKKLIAPGLQKLGYTVVELDSDGNPKS